MKQVINAKDIHYRKLNADIRKMLGQSVDTGKKTGEELDGTPLKLSGFTLKITGGSDKDGFPMRPNIHGGIRIGAILSGGVGFHATRKGDRKRKTLRGNIITDSIVQINMKVTDKPKGKKLKEEAPAETETAEAATQ